MDLVVMGYGTSAIATLENRQSGKKVAKEFYSPDDRYDATGTDAVWVIEQIPGGTPLANFGTLQFTGCAAFDNSLKKAYDVSGAQGITLQSGSKTLAVGSIEGYSTVNIEYER